MFKCALGLGPNVSGSLLGIGFFGGNFGSSWATRRYIMSTTENPEPAKFFRDIRIVTEEKQQ